MLSRCCNLKSFWKTLLLGQIISALIAGTGIFASFLSFYNANYPNLLNILNYSLLSCFLIKIYFGSDASLKQRRHSLWWYLFAAILDVEANFMVIMAYNFTSITSIMMLDCTVIPFAMLFSYYFLNYKYTSKHVIAAVVCILGLVCIVVGDTVLSAGEEGGTGPAALKGDLLCIGGSILYAASNVLQEHLVKSHDNEVFMGWMGSFAAIISFIQFWIVDYPYFDSSVFTWEVNLFIAGFVLCLFLMYVFTSNFLARSDATLFNLSLLSSDIFSVIFAYLVFGQLISYMYCAAFVLVAGGILLYNREKSPGADTEYAIKDDTLETDVLMPRNDKDVEDPERVNLNNEFTPLDSAGESTPAAV